jgi:hypothetical protein
MGSFLFLKIAEDPLIFSVPTGWTFAAGVNHCRRLAAGRNFYVVAPVYWDVATTTHLRSIGEHVAVSIPR